MKTNVNRWQIFNPYWNRCLRKNFIYIYFRRLVFLLLFYYQRVIEWKDIKHISSNHTNTCTLYKLIRNPYKKNLFRPWRHVDISFFFYFSFFFIIFFSINSSSFRLLSLFFDIYLIPPFPVMSSKITRCATYNNPIKCSELTFRLIYIDFFFFSYFF